MRNAFLTVGLILISFLCLCQQAAAEPITRVGVVLSVGGLGDKSFNDAVYTGIQNLRKLPGCLVEVVEPADVQSMEPAMEYLSNRRMDLIVGVGLFANDAIRKVSAKYPDLRYALLDSVVTGPNVLSIIFNEEQGSFYAGSLAGLLTRTQSVGFLGGMTSPVIAAFEKGFRNGVHFVNPTAVIVSRYAGDSPEAFQSPDLGRSIGLEMAKENIDIIYHAAGGTGLGLIDAARQGKFLVIGVDSDQSTIVPGKIAASMVKRLDVGLGKAFQAVRENRFVGGILTLGLTETGVDLVLSRFNKSLFTPLVMERMKEVESFLLHPTPLPNH